MDLHAFLREKMLKICKVGIYLKQPEDDSKLNQKKV